MTKIIETIKATACCMAIVAGASPAFANGLQETINNRDDLSTFRNLLAITGSDKLIAGGGHTVFAPVNQAFNYLPQDQYPYLYSVAYPAYNSEASSVAQNHIVNSEVYLSDSVKHQGGVYAVNGRFIPISEGTKGDYYVDGHRVLYSSYKSGGMFYVLDGVIARPWEVTALVPSPVPAVTEYAPAAGGTTIQVPEDSNVVIERKVTPQGDTTRITTY